MDKFLLPCLLTAMYSRVELPLSPCLIRTGEFRYCTSPDMLISLSASIIDLLSTRKPDFGMESLACYAVVPLFVASISKVVRECMC